MLTAPGSFFSAGNNNVICLYSGDSSFFGGNATVVQDVKQVVTATLATVPSGQTSTIYGSTVYFQATFMGGDPSSATFSITPGPSNSTVVISGGVANYSESTLNPGTYTISVFSNADVINEQSNTATITSFMVYGDASLSVSSSSNPSLVTQSVTFTIKLTPVGPSSAPTVNAQLSIDSTASGSCSLALVAGVYTCTVALTFVATGTYSVSASLTSDPYWGTITSSSITQTVNTIPTTLTYSITPLSPSMVIWLPSFLL
jgi:hypothetical protein